MGILSGNIITHLIKRLSVRDVKDSIKIIRQCGENESEHLRLDVDISWIVFKIGANKKPPQEAVTLVCDFLQTLAKYGFVVTPICDGEIRHHSKRASTDCVSKREKDRVKATVSRLQLLNIGQQINNTNDVNEKERLKTRQAELNKVITTLENKVAKNGHTLPPSFAVDLDTELATRDLYDIVNDNYGKIHRVKVGLFQADSLIAKRAIEGRSDAIVAADADFFVSVGPSCLLIKNFEYKRARGRNNSNVALMELHQLQIGCSSLQVKNNIETALSARTNNANNNRDDFEIVEAKYPILDEETIRLRALVSVLLGCDVFVGGVSRVGAKKIFDKMKQLREQENDIDDFDLSEKLIQWSCNIKDTNVSEDLLRVYIDAILFEPVNEVRIDGEVVFDDNNEKKYNYLYQRPQTLPKYLEGFCKRRVSILMKNKNNMTKKSNGRLDF